MTLSPVVSLLPSRLLGPVRDGKGLLLVASGGLGDNVLLSRVVERFLPLAQPGEPVTLLLRKDAAGTAFLFPPSIAIETYDWRKFRRSLRYRWSFGLALRRHGFRLVVSTDHERHPLVDELLIACCGCEALGEEGRPNRKLADVQRANRRYFSRLIEAPPAPAHRLRHWVGLANGLCGQNLPMPSLIREPPPAKRDAVVVLHPFSSDRRREAPPDLFERILEAIPAGYRILLSVGPGDLEARPDWRAFVARHQDRIDVDAGPLRAKYATLATATALVSVDTCLVHLGTLANLPTFCLCSAAYQGWSVPYDADFAPAGTRFYHGDCPQAGCLGQCAYPLRQGCFPCLTDWPEERLLDDLRKVLPANP
ncbi:glycosyltransferase family 9 protein [Telmatospirillum siberiense]|uniref:glycosyltransferase family 9 protein n=1 Tax=Telmatospirillum siberiense TaxID=382514 RepID=UPI0011AF86D9|nr:glycosyltransferase family 9 protein [Telmatospirillum siberiense]